MPLWERVLELDENNELACSGIGKAYLSAGDNQSAMKYLKLGMNRDYYSVAFKRYRSEILRAHMGQALTALGVVLVVVLAVTRLRKRRKAKKASEEGGLVG